MRVNGPWHLLLMAAAADAIAAGATLDQAIKQLPARDQLGALAYADYVRAADLGNGLIWYPLIGIGAALLSLAAVVAGLRSGPGSAGAVALSGLAIGTVGQIVVTARAAPTLLMLRHGGLDAEGATGVLDDFTALNGVRAGFLVGAVIASFCALATTTPRFHTDHLPMDLTRAADSRTLSGNVSLTLDPCPRRAASPLCCGPLLGQRLELGQAGRDPLPISVREADELQQAGVRGP